MRWLNTLKEAKAFIELDKAMKPLKKAARASVRLLGIVNRDQLQHAFFSGHLKHYRGFSAAALESMRGEFGTPPSNYPQCNPVGATLRRERVEGVYKFDDVAKWRKVFGVRNISKTIALLLNAEATAREAGSSLLTVDKLHFVDSH